MEALKIIKLLKHNGLIHNIWNLTDSPKKKKRKDRPHDPQKIKKYFTVHDLPKRCSQMVGQSWGYQRGRILNSRK